MALITPELLAQIKAAFLKWLQGLLVGGSRNSAEMMRLIESLIRYRLIRTLGPATPKTPVLGGIGVAYGPVQTTDGVPCPFRMDTGMIAIELYFDGLPKPLPAWSQPWGAAGAAGLIPPLLIYAGPDLQDYLQGSGTSVPGIGTGAEYLIGEESEDASRPCPQDAGLSFTDWPNTAPALSSALQSVFGFSSYEAYSSSVYLRYNDMFNLLTNCGSPGEHSGLLKLAVQAKIGAAKSPAQLAVWRETLCPLKPGRDGIFRDVNGVHWLIKIDLDGCFAQRMKNSPCTICINEWISDGLVTGSDLIKAQAFVFAGLSPDYAYAEVELLDAADLNDIYEIDPGDNDRVRQPLRDTGWHYSHGHLGTGAGEVYESSVVTHELYNDLSTQYRLASLWTITFNFGGSSPTASLRKVEDDIQWEPSVRDYIYAPISGVDGNKICYEDRVAQSADVGTDAPLYCWYIPDKGLEVIRYNRREAGVAGDAGPTHGSLCGGGVYHYTRIRPPSSSSATLNGSIEAEASEYVIEAREADTAGAWRYDTMHLEANRGGGCTYVGGIYTQLRNWGQQEACNGVDTSAWGGYSGTQITTYGGTGSGWRRETVVRNPNVVRLCIIPHGECECAYLIEIISSPVAGIEYYSGATYYDPSTFSPPRILGTAVGLSNENEGLSYEVQVPIGPGNNLPFGFGCGGNTYTNNLRIVTYGPTGSETQWQIVQGALVTNHGVFSVEDGYLSSDYNDWAEWIAYTEQTLTDCGPVDMWTQVSYQYPEVYHSFGPSISKALIGKANWPEGEGNEGYPINPPGLFAKMGFAGWN